MIRAWFKSGTPWIWINAGAISIALVAVFGLLLLIMVRGMSHFWPANVDAFYYQSETQSTTVIAEVIESETVHASTIPGLGDEGDITRHLVKTGNRDILGSDFKWIYDQSLVKREQPAELMVLERIEWGNFYGYLKSVHQENQLIAEGEGAWPAFEDRLNRTRQIREDIIDLQQGEIGSINYDLERLRLKQRRLEIDEKLTQKKLQEIESERSELKAHYTELLKQTEKLYLDINRDSITAIIMDGREVVIPLEKIVKAWQPNKMTALVKTGFYFQTLWAFITEDPT